MLAINNERHGDAASLNRASFPERLPKNLATRFFDFARMNPRKAALIEPLSFLDSGLVSERIWTFSDVAKLVETYQIHFDKEGFRAGDRVLILLPVTVCMYALVAACLANGLTPVFIDHTMPRRAFIKAVQRVCPRAIFSTEQFFKYRFILPVLWRSRLYSMQTSGLFLRQWRTIEAARETSFDQVSPFRREPTQCDSSHPSLITLTSGSTGEPKAAIRRLDLLFHQREISKALWTEGEADVELAAFPLVVLNNLVYGVTTVLPAINFAKFAAMDDQWLPAFKNQIARHKVTRLIAPPSLLDRMSRGMKFSADGSGLTLSWNQECSSIRRLVTGGAPVPKWLMKKVDQLLPRSENFVVYGSTEAEPISFASFADAIGAKGAGYFVGKPISDIEASIVAPESTAEASGIYYTRPLASGVTGEVLVRGKHVGESYLFASASSRSNKLRAANGSVWHRTGDCGFIDSSGALHLQGRLADRVSIAEEPNNSRSKQRFVCDTFDVEHAIENAISCRSAFVKHRSKKPVLFLGSTALGDEQITLS